MEKSNGLSVLPVCPLAHSLLDKLTVIVGHCELLAERSSEDSVFSRHLLSNSAGGIVHGVRTQGSPMRAHRPVQPATNGELGKANDCVFASR